MEGPDMSIGMCKEGVRKVSGRGMYQKWSWVVPRMHLVCVQNSRLCLDFPVLPILNPHPPVHASTTWYQNSTTFNYSSYQKSNSHARKANT